MMNIVNKYICSEDWYTPKCNKSKPYYQSILKNYSFNNLHKYSDYEEFSTTSLNLKNFKVNMFHKRKGFLYRNFYRINLFP